MPPDRAAMRNRVALASASVLAMLISSPASAAHCAQGEIWRVHLDQCVDIGSALARAYVRPPHRAPRLAVRHVADADQPPYPLPPPAPAPRDDQATLDDDTFLLPDIEDGAPAIWRLCQAAPNLCKATEP